MRSELQSTGDTSLWAAVITQALADATVALPASSYKDGKPFGALAADRSHARRWFNASNRDFAQVCTLAGLDPEAVAMFAARNIAHADTEQAKVAPRETRAHGGKSLAAYGKTMTLREWEQATGIRHSILYARVYRGLTLEQAIDLGPDRLPRGGRGRGLNFQPSEGTGAGSVPQESPNIGISE